jgi:hypothetical protein
MSQRQEAFAAFGTTLRNVQWSWSARSEGGRTVVITAWQDYFQGRTYIFPPQSVEQQKRPGFHELIENLVWAREQCGGRVRAVISRAEDPKADPRKVVSSQPARFAMQLRDLDTETGAYTCEIVANEE